MHLPLSFSLYIGLYAYLCITVHANVEKTIFLAPAAATIPSAEPTLDDLGLERISPRNPSLRTSLNASFPTTEQPLGLDSWFFLENLTPGQRYEVRICWLASQPTSFTLDTYTLATTISNPPLFSSLSIFSSAHLLDNTLLPLTNHPRKPAAASLDPAPTSDSVLFLRIHAAADYFTTNKTLMQTVPPVPVDVILDPFLMNVFPRSLVPTAAWVVLVTGVAVLVARWVSGEVGRVILSTSSSSSSEKGEVGSRDKKVR